MNYLAKIILNSEFLVVNKLSQLISTNQQQPLQ